MPARHSHPMLCCNTGVFRHYDNSLLMSQSDSAPCFVNGKAQSQIDMFPCEGRRCPCQIFFPPDFGKDELPKRLNLA